MSIYKRFFRVHPGPLLDEVKRLAEEENTSDQILKAFCEKIGAKNYHVWMSGGLAGFVFESEPDQSTWRKKDKNGLYMPRRNTSAGRTIGKEINQLPRINPVQKAIEILGMCTIFPPFFGQGGGLCGLKGFIAGPLFLVVPWRDAEPGELENYRKDKEGGRRMSCDLDHLLWEPTPDLEEVREWEMLRDIDEKEQANQQSEKGRL